MVIPYFENAALNNINLQGLFYELGLGKTKTKSTEV